MDKVSKIAQHIRAIAGDNSIKAFQATVVSVKDDTCTIQLENELEISDVKLKSNVGKENGILPIPKIGSEVLVASLTPNLESLSVIQYGEIESFEIKGLVGHLNIDMVQGKIGFSNKTSSLYELLETMVDALKTFKVVTPVQGAPTLSTNVSPDSLTKIAKVEMAFKSLLKSD